MDIFEIVIMTIHITNVFSKKYSSLSDESIENLLYYRDCQHKGKEITVRETTPAQPVPLRLEQPPPERQPECPFPKMCCSLSCGDDCGAQRSIMSRQIDSQMPSVQSIQPMRHPAFSQPQVPIQPQVNQRPRKKKGKFPPTIQIPMPTRRNFGFTKEKIKGLISKDEDIRKILKDLVKVTIQKVDLLDMMTTAKPESPTQGEIGNDSDDEDDYYE